MYYVKWYDTYDMIESKQLLIQVWFPMFDSVIALYVSRNLRYVSDRLETSRHRVLDRSEKYEFTIRKLEEPGYV
jgi:hypothetical protein